jgi:hypothetical protein
VAQSDLGAKHTRACDDGAGKNLVLSAQYYLARCNSHVHCYKLCLGFHGSVHSVTPARTEQLRIWYVAVTNASVGVVGVGPRRAASGIGLLTVYRTHRLRRWNHMYMSCPNSFSTLDVPPVQNIRRRRNMFSRDLWNHATPNAYAKTVVNLQGRQGREPALCAGSVESATTPPGSFSFYMRPNESQKQCWSGCSNTANVWKPTKLRYGGPWFANSLGALLDRGTRNERRSHPKGRHEFTRCAQQVLKVLSGSAHC